MILDTNALSALADGAETLAVALVQVPVCSLPVVVLGEFAYGIARSRHRARYRAFLDRMVADSRVLEIDLATSQVYAAIRGELRAAGRPIPANDAWIAALARQHKLPVLSRDEHFDHVPGVRRVTW